MPKLPAVANEDGLPREPHVRETAQQLKQEFLDAAGPLVKQYVDAALGHADFTSINAGAREEVWEVLKKMMLQSSDKLELDIKTAEDVLKAVSEGKCTFEEGDKLLKLFKQVKDIETVGLVEGVGGLTINILSAPAAEPVKVVPTEAGHIIEDGEVHRD
jgi:hypothetical protein